MFKNIGSPNISNKQPHTQMQPNHSEYNNIERKFLGHHIISPLKGISSRNSNKGMIRQNEQLMHYQGLGLHTNELRIEDYQQKGYKLKHELVHRQTNQMTELVKQGWMVTPNLGFEFPCGFFHIMMQP